MRADHAALLEMLDIPRDAPVLWIPLGFRDPEADDGYTYEAVPVVPVQCCKHWESVCGGCVDVWAKRTKMLAAWLQDDWNLELLASALDNLNIPGRAYPADLPNN